MKLELPIKKRINRELRKILIHGWGEIRITVQEHEVKVIKTIKTFTEIEGK